MEYEKFKKYLDAELSRTSGMVISDLTQEQIEEIIALYEKSDSIREAVRTWQLSQKGD